MQDTSLNETDQTWLLVEEGLFEYPTADPQGPTLLANCCVHCRKTFFPKRSLCPYCFEKGKMEGVKLDQQGIIYACTVIHRNSPTGIIAPYAYGYVDIPANNLRIFSLLDSDRIDQLAVGVPVSLRVSSRVPILKANLACVTSSLLNRGIQ